MPVDSTLLVLELQLHRDDSRETACIAFADHALYPQLARNPGAFLHPRELDYFNSLEFLKRKSDFLLGRFVAKQALVGLEPSLAGCDIEIRPGVFQQPVVMRSAATPLAVCLTHSGMTSSAVAFPAGHPLGIDVEVIDPDYIGALKSQITADELPPVDTMRSEAERYMRVWTVKESLSKILRCGLTSPFSTFCLSDGAMSDSAVFMGGFQNFHQYRFFSIASSHLAFAMVHPARTRLSFRRESVIAFINRERPAGDGCGTSG